MKRFCPSITLLLLFILGCSPTAPPTADQGDDDSRVVSADVNEPTDTDTAPQGDNVEPAPTDDAPEPSADATEPTKQSAWKLKHTLNVLPKDELEDTFASFSADSKILVTGNHTGSIILWDVETGEKIRETMTETNVRNAAFSNDGSKIVFRGFADIYAADTETLESKKLCSMLAYDLAYWAEGDIVASCDDSTVMLWNVAENKEIGQLVGHKGLIAAVAFSSQGLLASGGHDKRIVFWDAKTGEQKGKIEDQPGWVASLAFSPDGATIAASDHDHTIVIWDVETKKEKQRFKTEDTAKDLAFSPDGKQLVEGSWDGFVYLWDLETGKTIAVFEESETRLKSIRYSSDGKFIAAGESGGNALIWEKQK